MYKNIFILLFLVASLIAANVDAEIIKNIDFLISYDMVEDDFVDFAENLEDKDFEETEKIQQEVEQ